MHVILTDMDGHVLLTHQDVMITGIHVDDVEVSVRYRRPQYLFKGRYAG